MDPTGGSARPRVRGSTGAGGRLASRNRISFLGELRALSADGLIDDRFCWFGPDERLRFSLHEAISRSTPNVVRDPREHSRTLQIDAVLRVVEEALLSG